MAKKRERLDVIYDMLRAVRDNQNQVRPTKLLVSSNLSPQMFKDYTKELLEKGFIVLETDRNQVSYYRLTEKGFGFLERYSVVQDFIDSFGL